MRRAAQQLSWVSAGLVVTGFFLPWVYLNVGESTLLDKLQAAAQTQGVADALSDGLRKITATIRRGAETITGELPQLSDIPNHVSGFQIPRLANREDKRIVMALMEMVTKERQIGLKSYAVYLLPGVALLCAGFLSMGAGNRWQDSGVGVLCAAVAGFGTWKILTTDIETLMITAEVGPGLWLSIAGYVGLSLAAFVQFSTGRTVVK